MQVCFVTISNDFSSRLLEFGAKQITLRRDVDAEDRQTINEWFDAVVKGLESLSVDIKMDYLCSLDFDTGASDRPTREYPFMSVLKVIFKRNIQRRLQFFVWRYSVYLHESLK